MSTSIRAPRWRAPRRATGALLASCGLAATVLAGCGSSTPPRKRAAPSTTTSTAAAAVCPLTGAPVPGGGGVPQRPALAVKVDNYAAARPQSGLDKADIVVEEPVEGGVTRYVAIFQCQQAAEVGPIRSARNIDIGILGEFGQPLFVHVGGINPVLANIAASPLIDLDLGRYGSVIQHPTGRRAPYSTYAATSALWNLRSSDTTPPSPVFSYSTSVPAGYRVSGVAIPFSSVADVVWKYDPATGDFLRQYGTAPDVLADGAQNRAANVVVQFVHVTYGPWVEDANGSLEVQANLYNDASGQVQVYRNGVLVPGTWHRSSLGQPTQFLTTGGQPIVLAPGPTWIELVPDTVTVSPLAAPPAPPTTAKAAGVVGPKR
ncbi:MAG TPA: DUF3048 domain-containing protein [Acidimicrobiales bacterium]|nr:DUF3048 domain-containing protein [Acidimicrobiales bacterium]